MAITDRIELLKKHAERCRHLAATAADEEVARALLQIASDMDEVVRLFHRRPDEGDAAK